MRRARCPFVINFQSRGLADYWNVLVSVPRWLIEIDTLSPAWRIFWRIEDKLNPCWCASCDDVTGLQGETSGNRRNERRDVEDQVARIGILAKFTIHPAFNIEILGIEIVAGRDPWTHRTEGVERFAKNHCLLHPSKKPLVPRSALVLQEI
jgi:hypothetical protein